MHDRTHNTVYLHSHINYIFLGASSAALSNNLRVINHRTLSGNETLADRNLVDTWLQQVQQQAYDLGHKTYTISITYEYTPHNNHS